MKTICFHWILKWEIFSLKIKGQDILQDQLFTYLTAAFSRAFGSHGVANKICWNIYVFSQTPHYLTGIMIVAFVVQNFWINSWKVLWILSQLLGNILPRLKVQITRITTYTQKNQTKIKRKTRARSSCDACDAVFSLPAPQSCLHTRSFSWIDSYMNWFQNQFLFQN